MKVNHSIRLPCEACRKKVEAQDRVQAPDSSIHVWVCRPCQEKLKP